MNGWLLCRYLYVSLLNFPFPDFAAHSIGLSPNYWIECGKTNIFFEPELSCLLFEWRWKTTCFAHECLVSRLFEWIWESKHMLRTQIVVLSLVRMKMENHMLGTWMLLDLPACNNAEEVTSNWTFFLLLAQGFRSWWICGGAHWWWCRGADDDDAVMVVMLLLVIMEDRAAGSSCSPAATAAVLIDEEPSMWSLMRDSSKIFYQQQVLSSHPSLFFVCLHVAAMVWVHSKCGDIHVDHSSLLKEQTEQRNSNQGRCHCCCFCCKGFWL